jgi:cation diffusion facilitator CzcD-associated flavoprotein CzcO
MILSALVLVHAQNSIGCACDIPAHTYTYSFEPNTEWSGFYSYSQEIQEYFMRFYKKYELQPFVKLNTEVLSATWDEVEGICWSPIF